MVMIRGKEMVLISVDHSDGTVMAAVMAAPGERRGSVGEDDLVEIPITHLQ